MGSGKSFRDLGFRVWFERRILRLEATFSGGLLGGPWGIGKQVSSKSSDPSSRFSMMVVQCFGDLGVGA